MIRYGADPEFFSVIKNNNKELVISPALLEITGQIIPIEENIKHPIYISNKDYSWMMDGVAWELTIKHPLKSYLEMYKIINSSLECLEEFISKLNYEGQPLYLYKKPVVEIEPEFYLPLLENEKVFQGFIFGCDPDKDAIISDYQCATLNVKSHGYRYGGGHFHLSGESFLYENILPAVRLLAITMGNFVVANSPYPELDKQRVETYGKPGRYRPQIYKNAEKGLEYRTPSNSWCSYSLEKMEELFYWINKGIEFLLNPETGKKIILTHLEASVEAITQFKQKLSKEILDDLLLPNWSNNCLFKK